MFAIPGICALVVFVLARPQEFFEVLQKIPLLYIFCAAAIGGFAVDLRLRRVALVPAPTFKWIMMLFFWGCICDAVKIPDQLVASVVDLGILLTLYLTIAHGAQGFRAFQVIAATLMATCLFITVVCVHQSVQPRECIAIDETHPSEGQPDGRDCEEMDDCFGPGAEPGAEYICERVGLLKTFSIEDRIRYRGELQDPNEVALVVTAGGATLLIAFALRRRNAPWTIGAMIGVPLVVWCVLASQSRGGIVAMALVGGAYFVKKIGPAGIGIGAGLAVPMMALAGRSGEDADMSTQLRYEAWDAGLDMFKHSPIFGVGTRQYGDYFFLTAHNSYVLTLAEMGMIGMVLFVSVLVLNVKMLYVGVRTLNDVPGAAAARTWGLALLAGFGGILFQIFTLSFAYHAMLWIYFGLAGAWASSVKAHKPDFDVKLTWRDLFFIVVGCVLFTFIVLPIYLHLKGV
ncbi:MAG: O-antigen ligase family protein [Deltaproteobacteria bacterium]|nr:O-antigen ligase family protein [Deltaproteobacteria bacterium]